MWCLKPLQFFLRALASDNSPGQLAAAFSLGLLIGLVPKGNLLAAALMLVLCVFRVNLGLGLLAAFVFSWIGVLLDPVADRLGYWLLTMPSLQSLWSQFFDLPVAPWTALNNSVVLGNFVIGLVLAGISYPWLKPILARHAARWMAYLQRYRIVKVLWGLTAVSKVA